LRRTFLRAVVAAQNGTPMTRLTERIRAGDIDGAIDAVPWKDLAEPIMRDEVVRVLRDTLEQSGTLAARALPVRGANFSIIDPRPTEWLRTRSSDLVVEIGTDQRDGLRQTLAEGMRAGRSALRMAQDVKAQIGLHSRWQEAVANFSTDLDGKVTAADAARQVARYSAQLTQARAMTIARTEAARASMAGRKEAWAQAEEKGWIDARTATWTWVMVQREHVESDPCPYLDGQTLPYGQQFLVDGEPMTPPAHPNCVCSLMLNI
jgi:hypothetical protein